MAETNWMQLGLTLIGGGAAGAIITNSINAWKARKQPVRYSIERERVFRSKHEHPAFTAKLSITSNGQVSEFDNLLIVNVLLVNTGNKDLDKFSFGVTASEGTQIIWAEGNGSDRHHVINLSHEPQPSNPVPLVDFECRPFHRHDSYRVKLYLVSIATASEPATIHISTPESVKFVEASSLQLRYFSLTLLDAMSHGSAASALAHLIARTLGR